MNLLYAICLAVASILSFYLGLQYGGDKRDIEFMVECETKNIVSSVTTALVQPAISVPVLKEIDPVNCPQASSENMCHDFTNRDMNVLHLAKASTPEDVFGFLHHPSSPSKWNYFITKEPEWKSSKVLESPCQEIYLTRTGSRSNQPNKCVAVAVIPEGYGSINQQNYRVGYTALNTNQYQQDYPRDYANPRDNEKTLLVPFLKELKQLIVAFKKKMGDPIDPVTGKRRMAIVMVANTGVMDLLLNFICSTESAKIDLKNVIVFVGDIEDVALVTALGANAIYSPSLGSMPSHAAGGYLDDTFSRMMWFKTTSVYLALNAGFEVMFQDVDLVWLRDPFPYFLTLEQDILFMDDGARTPRYTPFFVNSGFYYVKYNERTLFMFEKMMKCGSSEIGQTHSHQSVLIRHISEAHHLIGLKVFVLDTELFPSGQAYHENKPLIKKIQAFDYQPFVFHMCWTDNRENKVVYFKDVGLWYIAEDEMCNHGDKMLQYNLRYGGQKSVMDKCCVRSRYWPEGKKYGEDGYLIKD